MMVDHVLLAAPPARAVSALRAPGADMVRLGQVADLSALPVELRGPAQRLPVARFALGQEVLVTTPRRIADVARRQMPALGAFLTDASEARITVVRSVAAPATTPEAPMFACARVRVSATAGRALTTTDLDPAACGDEVAGPWRYDQASATIRATRDLQAGEVVRAPPLSLLSSIRAGQPLRLSVRVGAVTVEREVQAVQSVRTGGEVFVRGADGAVFATRALEVQP